MRNRYGLEREAYRQLHEKQRGACAICGRKVKLAIDHDHATGNVRGLLCWRCNRSLAAIEDPAWVALAQEYLARFK